MMKKLNHRVLRRVFSALAALCMLAGFAWAEDDEVYVENELNYVDGSIDVSNGIPDSAGGVLARIKKRGVLRVATEPYFAPQEFIDPELEGQAQYVGADMELARLIAERMGVELEIYEMDFSEVLTAVADDKCDLAISALSFTPTRAASNEMSKGYYFSDIPKTSLIIRTEDADGIKTIEDLADKTLIAQRGSLQETMLANNVFYYKEFRRVTQTQMVYTAVTNGTADVGAVDAETALEYIENHPDCGLTLVEGVEFELKEEYQGDRIAGKKGELMLMYFVNGVIDEVLQDDRYEAWIEVYKKRAAELGL